MSMDSRLEGGFRTQPEQEAGGHRLLPARHVPGSNCHAAESHAVLPFSIPVFRIRITPAGHREAARPPRPRARVEEIRTGSEALLWRCPPSTPAPSWSVTAHHSDSRRHRQSSQPTRQSDRGGIRPLPMSRPFCSSGTVSAPPRLWYNRAACW